MSVNIMIASTRSTLSDAALMLMRQINQWLSHLVFVLFSVFLELVL